MENKAYYKKLEENILTYVFGIEPKFWRQADDSPIDLIYSKNGKTLIAEFKSRNIHSEQYDSFFIEPHKIKGIFNKIKQLNLKNYSLYFVVYCVNSNDIFVFNLLDIIKNGLLEETGNFKREKNHISNISNIVDNSCYMINKKLNIKKIIYNGK